MIMEDYIASPCHFRSSTWSTHDVPVTPPSEIVQLKPGRKTPEAAATIRDLIDEPIFWRGYTSDEEVVSPLVDDSRSFDSSSLCYDSEDVVSIHDAERPQRSTQSLSKTTQAQAVQFLSAGKAKVVSMPTSRVVRTAPSSPTRPPVSKMNRMNIEGRTINFSRTITPKVSHEIGDTTNHENDEGLPHPKKVVRRKPDVPALQAVSRSQSPSHGDSALLGPLSSGRAGFVEPDGPEMIAPLPEAAWFSQMRTAEEERRSSHSKKASCSPRDSEPQPYPAHEASPVPDSPPFSLPQKRSNNDVLQGGRCAQRPARFSSGSHLAQDAYTFPDSPSLSRPRLLRKLSTTFSFKTFNRPSRQDSFSSSESEKLQPVNETAAKSTHAISDMQIPTRTSSKPLAKMVPRGADERAPPIVIPPCPEDYDDGDLPARWPQRKGSIPACEPNTFASGVMDTETKPAKAHQRKKSHSTSSGSGSS